MYIMCVVALISISVNIYSFAALRVLSCSLMKERRVAWWVINEARQLVFGRRGLPQSEHDDVIAFWWTDVMNMRDALRQVSVVSEKGPELSPIEIVTRTAILQGKGEG